MTNLIFKTVLSMSVSGSLFILIFFGSKHLLKNTCSRQWQYYVWLIVILRLLLPFGPEISLMERVYQTFGQTVTQVGAFSGRENLSNVSEGVAVPADGWTLEIQKKDQTENGAGGRGRLSLGEGATFLIKYIGLIWLAVALGILVRKITAYQSFVRYVMAGAEPVSDITLLDELSVALEQMGIDRSVELCVNPLLASPMLIGIFHPCIVLPCAAVSKEDFRYIVWHELIHCKRWDILYKWLVQAVSCLHWFNPLVHIMSREITGVCEFSCDEAVLAKMGYENAKGYAKTLLDAMAAVGKYREFPAVVTLSANKELLKERLGAIMNCGKKSGRVHVLTIVWTVCIVLGMVFVGVYPTGAEISEASEPAVSAANTVENIPAGLLEKEEKRDSRKAADWIEVFYEADNIPMFQLVFDRLDEEAQSAWLDGIYRDGEIAFFGAAVQQLNADDPLIQRLAEKAYVDGSVSFFSVLADQMEESALEEWLERAIADQKNAFLSILFDELDMIEEKDEWEKEMEEKLLEEYRAVGVTMKGKNYYYQGKLVNIFLDQRPNTSFYTLNMNPAGVVNIKILRGEDGQIKGAAYLTEEEFAELFGDEEEWD